MHVCNTTNSVNIRREGQEDEEYSTVKKNKKIYEEKNKKKKKKVRTYGRTGIYNNFDPKWIKKGLAPSKNPSE